MPLPIAHGLVGAGVVAAFHPRPFSRYGLPLLAGAALAVCPDFDFGLVILTHDRTWHRGFTHSLTFGLLLSLAALALFGWRRRRETLTYGAAYLSHGLLDFATTKYGGGVQLLWPFTRRRFGLHVWSLSELPGRLSAIAVLKYLAVEAALFVPPFLLLLMLRIYLSNSPATRRQPL